MTFGINTRNIFKKHIALPQDHGSWVFLLSPMIIGIFAGGRISLATGIMILSAFSAFLIRQPITIAVKIYSGRRSKRDLTAAVFWAAIYGILMLLGLVGLVYYGYSYVLLLAVPGIPVFAWYLWLVNKRSERRQVGVEIVASGVLALTAPAGYWIGLAIYDPVGWLLFLLIWLQSAASIVYTYLRLNQRELSDIPDFTIRLSMGRRALLYSSFNLMLVFMLSITDKVPALLPIPYAVQWLETVWGTLKPAVGVKPTIIGVRQLIISTIFTILFIVFWGI
jgi:hypothetical protein